MVKRVRVLDEALAAEAEVPYEQTRLARQARISRRRLTGILATGAIALLLEGAVAGHGLAFAGAGAVALTAWGVRQGRLGGLVSAALASFVAVLLPVRLFFVADPGPSVVVALVVAVALGAAALVDVVWLLRDAELQHAYGRWAVRDD